MSDWTDLPTAWDEAHGQARLVFHHALQIVAAAGITHLEHDAEFQHSNVSYEPAQGGFMGRRLNGEVQLGMGGSPPYWRLYSGGVSTARLRVAGQTVATGVTWSRVVLARAGLADKDLELPTWDLPAGPFDAGTVFPPVPDEAYHQIQTWYENALRVLGRIEAAHGGSPVRVWPHHFDIATLIDLGDGKSIGVGMSPGGPGFEGPYLYVTPWPYPEGDLPDLAHGRWHTEGWTGAVLEGSALPDTDQGSVVEAFVAAAIQACRVLLS